MSEQHTLIGRLYFVGRNYDDSGLVLGGDWLSEQITSAFLPRRTEDKVWGLNWDIVFDYGKVRITIERVDE